MGRASRVIVHISLIGLLAGGLWWWQSYQVDQTQQAGSEVYFFDIGQGDASYIRSQSGNDIIIDGGPDDTVVSQLGQVMPFNDRTIELMVLTHPHADHVNGLTNLLEDYQVDTLLYTGVDYSNAAYSELIVKAKEAGTTLLPVCTGQVFTLSATEQFKVLYPFCATALNTLEDVNDTSIVLQYTLTGSKQDRHILFIGDVGESVERELLANGLVQPNDILKVGHHGSATASSADFLQMLQPDYAVIQVGADNHYGHPSPGALERLNAAGATTLRNDLEGTIHFSLRVDGSEVKYEH